MEIGHNSTIAAADLNKFVERIENLNDEIKDLQDDRKDLYAEAKKAGFDTRTIREIVKLRAMDQIEREEREALRETYLSALGMLADLPLGQAALRAV